MGSEVDSLYTDDTVIGVPWIAKKRVAPAMEKSRSSELTYGKDSASPRQCSMILIPQEAMGANTSAGESVKNIQTVH